MKSGRGTRGEAGVIVATVCLLLCTLTPFARADGKVGAVLAGQRLDAMIDCGLWLESLDTCPTALGLPANVASALAPARDPSARPDFDGIRRDTYYFLGLQLSVIGVLYFMPESVSGWSDEQKDQHRADKWWDNVTDPTWDDDDDYINYVLHPYWGAAYYVRARERGYGGRQAFWYSFLLSTLYEGGVEALFEPISIQDFFVTPIVGSWLGGYFMDWREATEARILATGERRLRDHALLVATDPLGHAADFVDRRFGRDAEFAATPFVMRGSPWTTDGLRPPLDDEVEETYGIRLTLRW